jgi:hypothetical protein
MAIVGFLISENLKTGLMQSVIINIASTLISIPLVFIVYDLYKNLLVSKSAKLINKSVDKKISDIFLRFIFFSQYFYQEFNANKSLDLNDLSEHLKKDKDTIFNDVSSNRHHGYFIFSIFDNFDIDIDNILASNKIISFISLKEIAVLQKFINDFNDLTSIFSFISDEDFIKHQKLLNTHLEQSKCTNSSDEMIFYDINHINSDNSKTTYYSAKYYIFEEEPLTYTYKLSGNLAKQLSNQLYVLYDDIKRWMKLRGINELEYTNAMVSIGRLHLDDNITFNEHMTNNISIHGGFN